MTFFDRFSNRDGAGKGDAGLRSVIDNLNHILNTRQGFGSFLKGYGIRDMNEYSSRDHLSAAVMEEVRFNIEQYEPRLEVMSISIENDDDPFRISFRIECNVKETRESLLMEFNSVNKNLNVKSV
ncbi:type VI secretion system baseplate subunit TssE [Desulfoluna sp.]|uniref:type VI secretion system baseplate subunit TssE n=1 Tax=Desulfoluna sp. TaxID=2045199 RepID=UPI00262965B4|nr:type VI secretion system baseplate subunit TssE [Desulfoluna sp.]